MLKGNCLEFGTEIRYYGLVPNHAHLILTPRPSGNLSRCVGHAHRRDTRSIHQRSCLEGPEKETLNQRVRNKVIGHRNSKEMPVPSMRTQLKIRELYRRTQALKSCHATIRQANGELIPATLERVFSEVD